MTAQARVKEDPPVPITPEVDFVRIRFAGDSGDGIQLTGTRFAETSAEFGNDFATFPDYPAEIRAPAGTTYGVSAYSINIGKTEILTSGDQPDVLVALNPTALKINLPDLRRGGTIIVDADSFTAKNLSKAGYESNPLDDDTLARFTTIAIGISSLTKASVADMGIGAKDALRCKNMWTLGLVLWMFGRGRQSVIRWLNAKFKDKPEIAKANIAALQAGNAFGETAEMGTELRRFTIPPAPVESGVYRTATGADTLAWGLYAGSRMAGLKLVLGSYPITPASTLLHILSRMGHLGVTTFQAEDEIAAVCSAIGASYAGALGLTTSSGPGIALKTEAMGLAISAELPLVVVNVQRGGPSTGLPTKTEQADLLQAVFGRNGDAPVPVIAVSSANDCFDCGVEAVRWCPGCGDYAILKAMQKTLADMQAKREDTVFVSGIGCSSRFPYYMNSYGFHTIHGRAPAIATGIKLANPELDVWIATGDGDGMSIGGNHMLHVLRRNVDLQILLFNNEIYGLTKGQYSPTSRLGTRSPSTPGGSLDAPVNPCTFALGSGARFIARTTDKLMKHMPVMFERAREHRGASFLEILQNCIIYNDAVFEEFTDKAQSSETTLTVEHGKPLVFGKDGDKGIRIKPGTLVPEAVTLGENGVGEDDLLVHDKTDATLAHLLTTLAPPDFPLALGVLYCDPTESYEDRVHGRIDGLSPETIAEQDAIKADMDKIFLQVGTWTVE